MNHFTRVISSLITSAGIALSLLPATSHAQAPIRIQFAPGAISGEWKGQIFQGAQDFVLRLGRGQTLSVSSPDVYTWTLMGPDGQTLGCNGQSYCHDGEGVYSLPMSGDYVVSTGYRMSSCYNCPVAKTRKVNLVFIAK